MIVGWVYEGKHSGNKGKRITIVRVKARLFVRHESGQITQMARTTLMMQWRRVAE